MSNRHVADFASISETEYRQTGQLNFLYTAIWGELFCRRFRIADNRFLEAVDQAVAIYREREGTGFTVMDAVNLWEFLHYHEN